MGTVLIVDDERSIRETVKAFLEAEGHFVQAVEDADAGLAVLQHLNVDVVLSDIVLPGMSGVGLLRRIGDVAPGAQVVMMTGEPTLETASESLRLGAADYLHKPVLKEDILRVVGNALRVKLLHDEKLRLEEENRRYLEHLEQLVEKRTRKLAESKEALRLRAEELSLLNRLARKVNKELSVDESIRYGLEEILQAVNPDLVILFLSNGNELIPRMVLPEQSKFAWDPSDIHTVGTCLCGLAVEDEKAVYASDIASDPRCTLNECRQAGFRSFAALPLQGGSDIIGVLGMASVQSLDYSEKAPFLEALAGEISIGLRNSLLYEQVEKHAEELKASIARIEESETERKTLEQHLQQSHKLEAIGTLASGIAHDFNNILGAVIGYTEIAALEVPADCKAKESLRMVLSASERAKELVQQILAFSQQGEEEIRPIQLSRTIKEVSKFLRASIPSTIEIKLQIRLETDNILADPVQIHQVFMNLCTNAHHAMKDSGGVLNIGLDPVTLGDECGSVHPDLKPGSYLKATVSDTGHGMSPEVMERIFDPYFTTKEKGVGTGLGLSVVHGIVQRHGGAIVAESEPGKGARFCLYFPAIDINERSASSSLTEAAPTGKESVLFVDDEQDLVDTGKKMLEHLGYTVDTRTNSQEALAMFRDHPDHYDVVVTDMTMPKMTGDKLAMEIRRIRPGLPIVLCTGYSENVVKENAKVLGIKSLVMKPILMAKLAQAVREALDE